MLELCRRANLTGVGGASMRRLPAAQEGVHPSSAAGTEVTPPPSSAASATVLEDNSDPVDMDSGLTANEASVFNSDEIMYNPLIGRRARRLWRLFPETVPVVLVGLDLPDRRPRKSARWCSCENHARKMRTFFTRRLEPKTKSRNVFKWSLRPKRK